MADSFIGIKRKIGSEDNNNFINLANDAPTDLSMIDLTLLSDSTIDLCDDLSSENLNTIITILDSDCDCEDKNILLSCPMTTLRQLTLPGLLGMKGKITKIRSDLSERRRLDTPRSGYAFEIIDLTDLEDDKSDDSFWLYVCERFGPPQTNPKRQLKLFECNGILK